MATTLRLTYYDWITQHLDPAHIRQAVVRFASIVQGVLGEAVAITVLPVVNAPQRINSIVAGDCEIALMNPLGYVLARRHAKQVECLAVALRIPAVGGGGPKPVYKAQIYVNQRTGITKVSELRGRSFAFGVSFSTSNFLVPAWNLLKQGIHPLTAFLHMLYAGGHPQAAEEVYQGRADAGAGHDGVIIGFKQLHPDADQVLQNIFWTHRHPERSRRCQRQRRPVESRPAGGADYGLEPSRRPEATRNFLGRGSWSGSSQAGRLRFANRLSTRPPLSNHADILP